MTTSPRAQVAAILFTDLVGSTELMQRVGDERAQGLFQIHHRLLADAVSATGGSELQWLGDGLMAAFASPADAVRCAISVQQAAHRSVTNERLAVRVGLNVGEILRQQTGSGYFGTPVVVARRLCDRAEAGQILCTTTVSGLLAGRAAFRFRELGRAELKGIADPVVTCEVVYERDPGAALLSASPFVGRRGELARLVHHLGEARAGRGGLAMLVGEPGIGKTRTLEALAARAREAGAQVLWGRCFEGETTRPFAAFAEPLEEHMRRAPLDVLEKDLATFGPALSLLAPALRERMPQLPEPPPLQPDEERHRLLDAVTQVLLAMAARAPVLLVLDDLHWADVGTLALLRHVARFARRAPLLLVAAYRDVELDRQHPLAELLPSLKRETEYERVLLRGLGETEVGELLHALSAQEVPEALVRALYVETDGNPFFLREVLLHLVEERKLYRVEGRWRSDYPVEELGIPEGVRQVIGQRLSRLSPAVNGLLSAASGFQGAFRFEVAARAAGLEEGAALDALDEALAAQLVRPTGDAELYDFSHALIRHTLYAEQSPSRQVRLHRRLAEELERSLGVRASLHAAEIARQWHRSAALAGAERGVPHCLAAADTSERAAAHGEAAAFLQMAIDLLPTGDARRPRALGRLGLALAWSLRIEAAVRVAGEAGEQIAATEGPDAAADYVTEAVTTLWSAAQSPLAWRLAEQGLRYVGARRDETWAILTSHDLMRRQAEDPEWVGTPLPTPEGDAVWAILRDRIVSGGVFYRFTPVVARYAPAEIRTDHELSPFVFGFVLGDYRRAVSRCEANAEQFVGRGALTMAASEYVSGARVRLALGEIAAADAWHAKAVALVERAGDAPFRALALLTYRVERAWTVDGPEALVSFVEPFQPTVDEPAIETRWAAAPAWAFAAYSRAAMGQTEMALAYLERARRAIDLAEAWAVNYPFLIFWASAAVWELERSEWTPLLERNLLEKTIAAESRYPTTDARLALAWLCALQNRHDEATQWLARARAVLDEQEARPLRAIVDFEEARIAARRGAPGDRERAQRCLAAAVPQFESIGMPGWIRRAQTLARSLKEHPIG